MVAFGVMAVRQGVCHRVIAGMDFSATGAS